MILLNTTNMGRKPKKAKEKEGILNNVKSETLHRVSAVIFTFIGIFFVLAPLDKAGVLGEKIYVFFKLFFAGLWCIQTNNIYFNHDSYYFHFVTFHKVS